MNSYATTKILRAKRTVLGRTFCRALGDQAGAALMEYVILGVLVAAAAVLAVTFFGKQIVGGFNTMIYAVTGKVQDAERQAQSNQEATQDQVEQSESSRARIAPGDGNR